MKNEGLNKDLNILRSIEELVANEIELAKNNKIDFSNLLINIEKAILDGGKVLFKEPKKLVATSTEIFETVVSNEVATFDIEEAMKNGSSEKVKIAIADSMIKELFDNNIVEFLFDNKKLHTSVKNVEILEALFIDRKGNIKASNHLLNLIGGNLDEDVTINKTFNLIGVDLLFKRIDYILNGINSLINGDTLQLNQHELNIPSKTVKLSKQEVLDIKNNEEISGYLLFVIFMSLKKEVKYIIKIG